MKALQSDNRQRHLMFHLALLFCCVAMVTYFLAFVSPHWLESQPEYHSHFLRIGLWEVCFDGYLHPTDYVSKAYFGCWYIYFPEFSRISGWLIPPWYYAVQMLGIVAFISILLSTIAMGSQFVRVLNRDSKRWLRANTIFHLLAGACIAFQLIVMAIQSRDRRWMPRPDQNRLGFAYAMALIACLACTFTVGFLAMMYIKEDEEQLVFSDVTDAGPDIGAAAASQPMGGYGGASGQDKFMEAGGGRYFVGGGGQSDSAV
ncbi:hypothetical protein BOX15_Mlig024724g2 [Macrostomum lignano]|uniref:Uncharacterized protein n=1 Tax=Macrostomum lignano TaxID=282301 RepID=A0A267DJY3_9PLAT|nr:hypothetical protein BOX15_Mlig024724g2 [Macrostomum lignano]